MRAIVILILIIIAIGLVRMLIGDVVKAVSRSLNSSDKPQRPRGQSAPTTGRFVKDPETGAYIDEASALRAEVGGNTYFFESKASRDAFLRKNRS